MELLQLRYFCHAAQTQNFSKTAQRFQVPPSAVSQSIKRLEQELGAALFNRRVNRIILNDRGQAFYREARKALQILDHGVNVASGTSERGTMRVGIHINRRTVMEAIERFQLQYTGVTIITTHEVRSDESDFDVLITDQDLHLPGLVRETMFREKIMLAAQKGAFPAGKMLVLTDLQDKSFITMNTPGSLYHFTRKICLDLGFEPRITLQSEDPFYIRKCVELGLGLAFVPEYSWQGMFSREIELWPVGDYSRDVCLYLRDEHTVPKYIQVFYGLLREAFSRG